MVRGVLVAALAVAALGFGGTAGAEVPAVGGTVTAADLAAARQAAIGAEAQVGAFLRHSTASVGGDPVAVYELSPEFVAGTSGTVGELGYVAVPARGADGSTASVWAVRDGRGWSVANIATGDVEARQARRVPAGGVLLREPQTGSWYAVVGGSVRPLAGGPAMSVADYQRQVQRRYGDKLPGSAYDRAGTAGGYGDVTAPAPRGGGPVVVLGFLLGAAALVGGAAALRRT
ncbi:hypothetical protein ACIGNX_02355 [Actinosynnema sp. NPDC053489]|uniref:hypothetical protein n=1 Tax=Actinosynnema sp. NPDC053489 TaxID=3363916 RepID=UPI0037CB3E73